MWSWCFFEKLNFTKNMIRSYMYLKFDKYQNVQIICIVILFFQNLLKFHAPEILFELRFFFIDTFSEEKSISIHNGVASYRFIRLNYNSISIILIIEYFYAVDNIA